MGFLNVKMKVILISTLILSMAMGLKLTLPIISHFLIYEAPSISTFFLTSLTPPYLYILLNFIILTILATSKFHNYQDTPPLLPTEPLIIPQPLYNGVVSVPNLYQPETTPSFSNDTVINGNGSDGYLYDVHVPAKTTVITEPLPQPLYNGFVSDPHFYQTQTTPSLSNDKVINSNGSDGYLHDAHVPAKTTVTSDGVVFTPNLQRKESLDLAFSNDENEKPPVSVRFGQRKAVRATPEGGKSVALGVAKSKKQDTLESTWKTITEGRAMPLTRHLKKSDTWEQQARRNAAPLTDLNCGGAPVMKKSETFNCGRDKSTTSSPGSGGRLRKEPSLSQDELNRRVEAFINKFNAEMRLQRQESLRQYREMINRGAH